MHACEVTLRMLVSLSVGEHDAEEYTCHVEAHHHGAVGDANVSDVFLDIGFAIEVLDDRDLAL